MWGRGAAALIAFAVLGSQPAMAGVRVDSEVSGALTVTWHGDPARGCADAGVCDVTGSVTLRANEGSSSGSSDTEHVLNLLDVQTQGGIVRVSRGADATCLDGTGEVRLTPRVLRRAGTRAVLGLGADEFAFGGQLGAGRCAGPLPSDVAAAMPQATVPERVLQRGGAFDLRFGGRRTFAAGPFAGSVSSTLELRGRGARTRGRIGPTISPPTPARPRRRRLLRVEGLVIGYRVAAADGALTTAFQGGPSPDCEALDACGLTGTHELTATPGATLNFFGTYPLGSRRPLTVDQLLAKARAGALRLTALSGPGVWHGQAAVSVTRPDGSGCRDARPVTLPGLDAQSRAADFLVALGGPTAPSGEDPLATRCPGPRRAGREPAPLATGTLPVSQAGAPRLTLRLTASGGELGAMPSSRGGELTLDLVRTRADVHTRKEPS